MIEEVRAIIWDYDGTLVDTRRKNLNVTRQIVKQVTGNDPLMYSAIQSLEHYAQANECSVNWRDFYAREFHMPDEQIDEAGRLWSECQQRDATPTPLFDGIREVLTTLDAMPHGIVSQNARSAIANVLGENGLSEYFGSIIGYEEVDLRRQKPEPDGLLMCIQHLLDGVAGSVLYIGDHETDTRCALNANEVLEKRAAPVRIQSVGATYASKGGVLRWHVKPDHIVRSADEIIEIVNTMPRM